MGEECGLWSGMQPMAGGNPLLLGHGQCGYTGGKNPALGKTQPWGKTQSWGKTQPWGKTQTWGKTRTWGNPGPGLSINYY